MQCSHCTSGLHCIVAFNKPVKDLPSPETDSLTGIMSMLLPPHPVKLSIVDLKLSDSTSFGPSSWIESTQLYSMEQASADNLEPQDRPSRPPHLEAYKVGYTPLLCFESASTANMEANLGGHSSKFSCKSRSSKGASVSSFPAEALCAVCYSGGRDKAN